MQIYFKDFKNRDDLLSNYSIEEKDLNDCEVLFAYYSYECYEGTSFVVLVDEENKKFYEVNGSHCSCYGLEGQWEMEETTLEALVKRDNDLFNDVVKAYISKYLLNQNLKKIVEEKPNNKKKYFM